MENKKKSENAHATHYLNNISNNILTHVKNYHQIINYSYYITNITLNKN